MHGAESESARSAANKDEPVVYFASSDQDRRGGIYAAVKQLFSKAGIPDAIDEGDVVAIKVHFGELGNTRYLHPVLVRRLVGLAKAAGADPL